MMRFRFATPFPVAKTYAAGRMGGARLTGYGVMSKTYMASIPNLLDPEDPETDVEHTVGQWLRYR